MNSHYIKALPIETLKEMLKKYLTQYDLTTLTDKLKNGTTMEELTKDLKNYSY